MIEITKPGVYDISNEQYHQGPGISRSAIIEFRKTPYHYWNSFLNPERPPQKEPSEPLKFGNALHTYILEKDKFHDRYIVAKKMNKATKAGKAYYKDIEIIRGNREIILENNFEKIDKIANHVWQHPEASQLIHGAQYEKSIFWTDPDTGLLCKARPDIWHPNMIGDLKSDMDASEKEFTYSIASYGYHIQAGMINQAILHTQGIDIRDFIYIVLEKEYPYAIAIYQLDELAIEAGISIFKNKLKELKECYEKNEWPSYPIRKITLPRYFD